MEGSLRANYVGRALQVYEQMCVSGLKPTVELCTNVVQGFFSFLFTMCVLHVVSSELGHLLCCIHGLEYSIHHDWFICFLFSLGLGNAMMGEKAFNVVADMVFSFPYCFCVCTSSLLRATRESRPAFLIPFFEG